MAQSNGDDRKDLEHIILTWSSEITGEPREKLAPDALTLIDRLISWHEQDRKQHELDARQSENEMYIKEVTRHYFPSSPTEPHIPLNQFYERIEELKAEREALDEREAL